MSKKLTTQTFIERASQVHGQRYGYEKSVYRTAHEKITITCPFHGDFDMAANCHLKGRGCRLCGIQRHTDSRKQSRDDFIRQANQLFESKYGYDLLPAVRQHNKETVQVVCPIHGPFSTTYNSHLGGRGCPHCKSAAQAERLTVPFDRFLETAVAKYGSAYLYEKESYQGLTKPMTIVCCEHGSFITTPKKHLSSRAGCCRCYQKPNRINTEECVSRFVQQHGSVYDYDRVVYRGTRGLVEIMCKKHGLFLQSAEHHWSGSKCPSCASHISKPERDILSCIALVTDAEVVQSDRSIIAPYELDIVVPQRKMAVEYCGLYYHSTQFRSKNYHKMKYDAARSKGYDLLTIFSDEWSQKRPIVESILSVKLGRFQKGCGARLTQVEEISYKLCADFLDINHIQGAVRGSVYLGAFDSSGLLVGVMVFGPTTRPSRFDVELKRFATRLGHRHAGLASKLLKYYISTRSPRTIVSFSDNRWFSGDLYAVLGFVIDGLIPADYHYVVGENRINKSRFRKSEIAKIFSDADPNQTELDIMTSHGVHRIFDCGKIRWLLDLKSH